MLAQAEGCHQLEHRHLDVARRLAGTLAVEEGGQQGVGEVQARDLVGGDGRRIEGRAVAHLEEAGKAGGGLDDVVVGGLAGVATVAAEADGGGVDDFGIGGAHGIEGEAQLVDGLLAHVVDEGVGGGDQLHERRLAGLGLEVEHDRALVAVAVGKDGGEAGCRLRRQGTHAVALRRLDLDDLGAKIPQDLRGVGAEDDGGEVEDAQAFEQGDHGGPLDDGWQEGVT